MKKIFNRQSSLPNNHKNTNVLGMPPTKMEQHRKVTSFSDNLSTNSSNQTNEKKDDHVYPKSLSTLEC